ncbi:MAG: TerD family protein [Mycobacteriales bacterium]
MLIKGQNQPLAVRRLRYAFEAGAPVDLCALLLAPTGRVRSDADFVFHNQPAGAGGAVRLTGTAAVDVDLDALPADVDRVLLAASLDEGTFGQLAPPVGRLSGADGGGDAAAFTLAGLDAERAVIAFELYRRQGDWKVRAVGQGYGGGLAELAGRHGVDVADPPPPPATPVAPAPPEPTADTAAASPDLERIMRQVKGIFEDTARSTAAYRSATGYAAARRDEELAALLDDPALRTGPAADAARAQAERRHDELVERATADYARDTAQLGAELVTLEAVLPASMARWTSPAWEKWQPGTDLSPSIRLGSVHLDDCPGLPVPLVTGLPLQMGLWVDPAGSTADAERLTRGLVVRLLAAYPPGELRVHVADALGGADLTGLPVRTVARSEPEVDALYGRQVERIDLIGMALESGAIDALPPHVDLATQLLVVHESVGLDPRLGRLLAEGPRLGLHVLLVADATPALEPIVDAVLRLSAAPDVYLADPWVGLAWTFTPEIPDEATLARVLAHLPTP